MNILNVMWAKISFIIASKYRREIVLRLRERPKTPKELAIETNIQISNVSSTLSQLSKENIVKCLTPTKGKGKLYSLTTIGKKILQNI